jgi:hypothetical protein
MPVMTASAINLPNTGATLHDFTANPSVNVYSASGSGVIPLETGVYGQISGELLYDNVLRYSGKNNDRAKIFSRINDVYSPPPAVLNSVITGYYNEDLNMDGIVRYSGPKNDQAITFSNIGMLTSPPTYLLSVYVGQVPVSYSGY